MEKMNKNRKLKNKRLIEFNRAVSCIKKSVLGGKPNSVQSKLR